MSLELAQELASTLPAGKDGLFNPYADRCINDRAPHPETGPEGRLLRLAAHLTRAPRFILIGEAAGWAGCRFSGMAFTSERLLLEGLIPGVERLGVRLTTRDTSFTEQSSTIVWKALYQLRLQDEVITWNALQMHPHEPGKPLTNRTPTKAELAAGHPALTLLRKTFPSAGLVAVGKHSAVQIMAAGLQPAAMVRHPANGGSAEFNQGMRELAGQKHH